METLDKHFRNLAQAAFQRHGFASEQLVAQWRAIVGDALAAISTPGKINWPRMASEASRKMGGTLVLRAAAGRGLELHYEAPRIIEKVNQFLGYGAIAALKIVQDPLKTATSPPPRRMIKPEAAQAWAARFDDIADADLKAALTRLSAFAAPSGPQHPSFSTGENRVLSHPPTSSRKKP